MRKIIRMISKYNYHTGNNIQYIVIHDVGEVSTARNNGIYFGGGDRRASAHYFVDKTETIQVVEDYNGAWHVGDGQGKYGIHNSNSIGIEMCLESNRTVSDVTRKHTLELVKYLMAKYNVPASRVVRHYDASRKNCPGAWSSNNWAKWLEFKSDVLGKATSTPTPSVKPSTTKYKEEKFTTQQVTDVSLNVRTTPDTKGKVVATLKPGTKFTPTLIVRNGENVEGYTTWCKHPKGWVSMAYTSPVKVTVTKKLKGEDLPSKGSYKFTVNTNIRSGAGTSYGIVGSYNKGETVIYDRKVIADGYVWLSYIGGSGYRRYVAVV